MKKTVLSIATALTLVGATLIPTYISARASGLPNPPAGQDERDRREGHPEIREAIRHLEQARESLQRGSHDFHGHRAKALQHTNQALKECHQALESDRR